MKVPRNTPVVLPAERFLTLPNLLSLLRMVLAVPFAWVMLSDIQFARVWATAILAVGIITDKLDGDLARRWHQVTDWGKILDPLADKVGVAAVVIVLLILEELPLWFVMLVLGRDVLIFTAGLHLKVRYGILLPSNETGKWAVGVIAALLILLVVEHASVLTDVLMVASVLMLLLSSYFYAIRMVGILRSHVSPKG